MISKDIKQYFIIPGAIVIIFIVALMMIPKRRSPQEKINVAVASNFSEVIQEIIRYFEAKANRKVLLSFGSTGKFYAQIKNGAPFDVFLAADAQRPRLLEQEGLAVPGSRFTYAQGKIVLWSPKNDFVDNRGLILEKGTFRYLALANPKLSPYGQAARQVLESLDLWNNIMDKLVIGENISQTFQFVESGNAELGFIAYSQLKTAVTPMKGSYWEVPQELYSPIEQQAVILKDSKACREFMTFLQSVEAHKIIQRYGYHIP